MKGIIYYIINVGKYLDSIIPYFFFLQMSIYSLGIDLTLTIIDKRELAHIMHEGFRKGTALPIVSGVTSRLRPESNYMQAGV
jgi:hypothetical protein